MTKQSVIILSSTGINTRKQKSLSFALGSENRNVQLFFVPSSDTIWREQKIGSDEISSTDKIVVWNVYGSRDLTINNNNLCSY